jgi:hypothetical protein
MYSISRTSLRQHAIVLDGSGDIQKRFEDISTDLLESERHVSAFGYDRILSLTIWFFTQGFSTVPKSLIINST